MLSHGATVMPLLRSPSVSAVTPPSTAGPEIAERLAALLTGPLGARVRIESLQRLSGGASRETWAFVAVDGEGRHELILRRDPPGRPGLAGAMQREAHAMRAAASAGLPVPRVLVDDDGGVLGTAGLVMTRVAGETIARRILRDDEYAGARERLATDLGRFLGVLHTIDPGDVPGLEVADTLGAYWDRYLEMDDVSPTFEAARRWLDAHRPPPAGPVVVHGDLRLGNVIVGAEGLRAAIDWELVHLGDPLEDLAWLCVKAWRFGAPRPVAGVGTFDDLFDAYESTGARPVDRDAFHWWLVMSTLKWGIGCMGQAAVHLTGALRSVELAAIGRRVAEQEWDLLELLAPDEWAAARSLPAEVTPALPADDLYGRPRASELLEAAREFVGNEVIQATDGRLQFLSRVTANVLGIVERELTLGPVHRARYEQGLEALGSPSTTALAEAVRRGDFDGRGDELFPFLVASVGDKLTVANPRHLTR